MNHSRLPLLRGIGLVALFVLCSARVIHADDAPAQRPTVNVILWFDTEDYLLPADDDADKRLADMLSERGIRATFKVVGEKARVLDRRGRHDVIDALKRHCIAYHSNFHSVHPAPAEYLADCGLLDGIDEFIRHESRGAADVRRIFNVPTLACYGQPGSSWAPQAIAALKQCGISNDSVPCYVDSGHHIGLHGRPYWYCGALVVYDMSPNETRMDLWDPNALPKAKKEVTAIADRLAGQGGGLISIYYHPCEWVHKEFWDGVNFRRGANPPREQWKPPGQRPPEETNAAFERFGAYIDHIRLLPGIRFVTAAQLPSLYPDLLRTQGVTRGEALELAQRITSPSSTGIDFQIVEGKAFSPADQFAVLSEALAQTIDPAHPASTESHGHNALMVPADLLGPDGAPPAQPTITSSLNWYAFRDATLDANDYVQFHHRIPARVFVGPDPVAPTDYLYAMATAFIELQKAGKQPESVPPGKNIDLLTAHHVVQDEPNVYGGWIIHREGLRAPKILDVARLQAWTLKPAMMAH